MFRKKDPERLPLGVGGKNTYTTEGSVPNQEVPQPNGTDDIKHCHDNSLAHENRNKERAVARKRLYIASAICLIFMIGEILGGYFAGSLAVMTDAAHLLVDLFSFLISLFALWISSRPATQRLNFGWHRAEILGALLSILSIWLVTGILVYFAVERLISNDYTIEATVMLITSGCAVLANIIMALTLHHSGHGHSHGGLGSHGHSQGRKKQEGSTNTNVAHGRMDLEQNAANRCQIPEKANASVRAAFVHVLGDLFQSISVFVSAIIIFFKPEYKVADPICTFLFSLFVLCTTITIIKDIVIVLMEGTPVGLTYTDMRDRLFEVKGVTAIHNLYIWALTMNQAVLSAHVAIDESADDQSVLREITQVCFSANFHSVTIQLEKQADLKPGCILCENPET
ncbi:proton-coupled zinc antiporter SLC30A2-like [Brachionichthys hirsutus]|uniref:proton-coupled zinc antiporter SLC30A2-like n=1 Tax=Brachionichthys hirsutus TaxID=412623 RepID=UPI0036052B2B